MWLILSVVDIVLGQQICDETNAPNHVALFFDDSSSINPQGRKGSMEFAKAIVDKSYLGRTHIGIYKFHDFVELIHPFSTGEEFTNAEYIKAKIDEQELVTNVTRFTNLVNAMKVVISVAQNMTASNEDNKDDEVASKPVCIVVTDGIDSAAGMERELARLAANIREVCTLVIVRMAVYDAVGSETAAQWAGNSDQVIDVVSYEDMPSHVNDTVKLTCPVPLRTTSTSTTNAPTRKAPTPTTTVPPKETNWLFIILGISIGALLLCCCLVFLCVMCNKSKKEEPQRKPPPPQYHPAVSYQKRPQPNRLVRTGGGRTG